MTLHDLSNLTRFFSPVRGTNSRRFYRVLGVVVLHMAVFGLLGQMPGAWRSAVTTQRTLTVVLLDAPPETPQRPVKPAWQGPSQQARAPALAPADASVSVRPASKAEVAPLTAQSPREAGAADVQSAAPLNLQLPPGWSPPPAPRHPALQAGQGPRQPLTLESRLAGALGDGHWTEERLSDGRLRLRNGHRCVDVQRNRSDELNPFNATPTPWTAREQAC